jgi:hypothetical protein
MGSSLSTFDSAKIASKITGVSEGIIFSTCQKRNKTGKGFIWKWADI